MLAAGAEDAAVKGEGAGLGGAEADDGKGVEGDAALDTSQMRCAMGWVVKREGGLRWRRTWRRFGRAWCRAGSRGSRDRLRRRLLMR